MRMFTLIQAGALREDGEGCHGTSGPTMTTSREIY
jgi:hypothetical protein